MKKVLFGALCAIGLLATTSARADYQSYDIQDKYWGANGHGHGDVIGTSFFDIAFLRVGYSGDDISVTVFTNYQSPHPNALGTTYGDLFISTDGWNPHGTEANHYKHDNAFNGEDWEFVFDTSAGKLYGGNFTVLLSEHVTPSGTFRNGQEVLRGQGGTVADVGSVTYGTSTVEGYLYQTITYEFDWSQLGVHGGDELGFRWEITCANDAIEGSGLVPVPLPATSLLLLTGLGGLGFRLRRRR